MHAFEVLASLEGLSGELAAQRIDALQLAEVRALHYEMLACFTRRDLSGYYRLNAQIHSAINVAAANPVLTNTYRAINARVQSLRFRTNQNEAKWKLAVKEHERIVDALTAHDGAALPTARPACSKRDTVLSCCARAKSTRSRKPRAEPGAAMLLVPR
jgi:DNA-binding GntR family transcriptional regulator